jgi:Uma2 family endonuclease
MAMTAPTVTPVTAEELLLLPEDGFRYELIRGELVKMPPPGYEHGAIAARFTARLFLHVEEQDLGSVTTETGFLLSTDPDSVRAPDVAFVSKERVEQAGSVKGYWPGAPDLAVEVVSPNDSYTEVEEKSMDWLRAGSRMVLVLNPRHRTVSVCRTPHNIQLFSVEETLDLGDVVPWFSIAVKDVFR